MTDAGGTGRPVDPGNREAATGFVPLCEAIRERVLVGWASSVARFREDANTEEDHALGGYRDRVLVELAQNAADAAARAGVPGRLLLALRTESDGSAAGIPVLVAANTGAPLDADGVQALATLRASAKRAPHGDPEPPAVPQVRGPGLDEPVLDGSGLGMPGPGLPGDPGLAVGRFGVGFSAVLAVSDEPEVRSRDGGVAFSRRRTRELAEGVPGLAEELRRRQGQVPALRLPFAVPAAAIEPEYDTEVRLPVRDESALGLVRRLLEELDDALLLALPALSEIRLELDGVTRVLADPAERWITVRRTGSVPPGLLADRPVEERGRTTWSLTWALPRRPPAAAAPLAAPDAPPGPGGSWRAVVHAPTLTDEELPWPALLIADLPLDPSRRHLVPGRLTELLLLQAAAAYAELAVLAVRTGTGWETTDLLPAGFPAGQFDESLREATLRELALAPVLVSAEDGEPLRPRDAVLIDGAIGADEAAVAALAPSVAGLVHTTARSLPGLRALGVRRLAPAELVEQLPAGRSPGEWRDLYAALGAPATDPLVREALAALPVPLSDGRLVRGVRGLVMVEDAPSPDGDHGGAADPAPGGYWAALARLGVRAVHPDATHRVLELLGAHWVRALDVLALEPVRAAVEASLAAAEDGDDDLTEAVLQVVAAAHAPSPADRPPPRLPDWFGALALRDADGEIAPARELLLPDSIAEQIFDPEVIAPVAAELVDRWGPAVLGAVGVRDTLLVKRFEDVELAPLLDRPAAADRFGFDEAGEGADGPEALPDIVDWAHDLTDQLDGRGSAEGLVVPELLAPADLDAVTPEAWPAVLALIAADPALRACVVEPVRLGVTTARSWTAWWLHRELAQGDTWAAPDADPRLTALLGPPPEVFAGVDPVLRRALGAVRTVAELDPAGLIAVLNRLAAKDSAAADPAEVALLLDLWGALGAQAQAAPWGLDDVPPAPRVRALRDGVAVTVEADAATVVDHPAWLQRTDLGAAVIARPGQGAALADALDLPTAPELAAGRVDESGSARSTVSPVPWVARVLLPAAPAEWCEHEELLVDGVGVTWWVDERVHACTLDGLARALAWAGGAWHLRATVLAALDGELSVTQALIDESLGGPR